MHIRELAERSFRQPESFLRYSCVVHAVGMSDEYPRVPCTDQWDERGTDCVLQPGMVVCIESYAGRRGGTCGVKLEEQGLLTEGGIDVLTAFPFEDRLLGPEHRPAVGTARRDASARVGTTDARSRHLRA